MKCKVLLVGEGASDIGDVARQLSRDRKEHEGRELYYLILYPRDPNSGYPTREQRQKYERWFEGVALGYNRAAIRQAISSTPMSKPR